MTPVRKYLRAAVLASVLTAAILATALTGLKIGGAIVASGVVQTQTAKQPMQHPTGGIIKHSFVQQGAKVAAGDALLQLTSVQLDAERSRLTYRHTLLRLEIARLQAERDTRNLTLPAELAAMLAAQPALRNALETQRTLLAQRQQLEAAFLDNLELSRAQTRAEIKGLTQERHALQEQMTLLTTQRDAQASLLQSGLTRASAVSRLNLELASVTAKLAAVSTETAKAESRLLSFETERLAMRAQSRERASSALAETERELLLTTERLAELQSQSETAILRAPFDGWVNDLGPIGPGAVLSPGQQAMVIVPEDRSKTLDARVDPRFAGQILPDQTVWIRLAGPNGAAQLMLEGRVKDMSRDAIYDPISQSSYFSARIALPDAADDVNAGTPAEVFFATGSRSVMSYLMGPITHYLGRALRES